LIAPDETDPIEHAHGTTKSPDTRPRGAVRLPRGRHLSVWSSRRLLLASLAGLVLLVPLWLDPYVLGQVRVTPSAPGSPSGYPQSPAAVGATPPPGAVFVRDDFQRDLAIGWGAADLGGDYSRSSRGFGALDVESGMARVRSGTSGSGWAWLSARLVRDVDVTVLVAATGEAAGSVSAGPVVRAGENGMYSVRLERVAGTAGLIVERIQPDEDADARLLGPIPVTEQAIAVGVPVKLRVEAIGSDPTTIRARAWPADQLEPTDWAVQLVDWSGPLQHAGGIGLSWGVSGLSDGGLDITFDDLLGLAIEPEVVP
jgi:hypothetical protein